jgi:hypothetical protein
VTRGERPTHNISDVLPVFEAEHSISSQNNEFLFFFPLKPMDVGKCIHKEMLFHTFENLKKIFKN